MDFKIIWSDAAIAGALDDGGSYYAGEGPAACSTAGTNLRSLLPWGCTTGFCYDLVDRAHDVCLRDRAVVGIRENDLASVCRERDQLRLYFVNPHLLIRCSLFVQFGIAEIERLAGRHHD